MIDNAANGVIRKSDDGYEIVFVRRLAKPIEKVWAALTVPERIADWLTDMHFIPDLRLGARVEIFFPDDDPPYQMITGEVVTLEPPRLFAWTWPEEGHPKSVVRCELQPHGDGCVLTFSQSGMGDEVAGPARPPGWHGVPATAWRAPPTGSAPQAASSARRRCDLTTRRNWRPWRGWCSQRAGWRLRGPVGSGMPPPFGECAP